MLRSITATALLLAAPLAFAAPTVKPGLWEVTKTHNGEEETDRECVTPEQARDSTSFTRNLPKGCTLGQKRDTASELSFDYSCDSPTQTGKGRMEVRVDKQTQYQLSYIFNGQLKIAGKAAPLNVDLKSKGRWLSSDCGDLAEDDAD